MTSIVFYDGACPLCSRVVRFVLKHERDKTLKFAKLQGAFAKNFLSEKGINALDLSTFYLFRNGTLYSKSTAALHLVFYLKWYFLLIWIFWIVPRFIRDFIYNTIAKNRYKIFKELCEIGALDKDRSLDL